MAYHDERKKERNKIVLFDTKKSKKNKTEHEKNKKY